MNARVYNVLFLCTGNSARSLMAEALLNHLGSGRFQAYSAGSHPTGQVNPLALAALAQAGIPSDGLRSKHWDEFGGPGAPEMDFVFTVCDKAAAERCPVWPGHPITGRWSFEDPAAGPGEGQPRRFAQVFLQIQARLRLFLNLPIDKLDRLALQQQVDSLG